MVIGFDRNGCLCRSVRISVCLNFYNIWGETNSGGFWRGERFSLKLPYDMYLCMGFCVFPQTPMYSLHVII